MPSVEEHLDAVGRLVRSRRRHCLLTQAELASRAQVDPSLVKRLETGRGIALMALVAILSTLEAVNPIDPAGPEAHSVLMNSVPRQGLTPMGAELADAAGL